MFAVSIITDKPIKYSIPFAENYIIELSFNNQNEAQSEIFKIFEISKDSVNNYESSGEFFMFDFEKDGVCYTVHGEIE